MITDLQGNEIDETVALHRIVAVLDLRFPRHHTPGDRLGRLLEELGELSASVMGLEQDATRAVTADTPANIAAKELQDVLCAITGIARHYEVPLRLPDPENYQHEGNPYLLIALLTQAGGVIADAVHQLVGMGVKRQKYGLPNPDQLPWALDRAIVRTLVIADHYGLRDRLRHSIQSTYQEYQCKGYLVSTDGPADES